MPHKTALALLSAVTIMGCSGIPVKRDYDEAADFARLKTYAWHAAPPDTDGLADNTLMRDRVRAAVNNALEAKGFKKSEGDPDFKVAYRYMIEKEESSSGVHTGLGLGFGSRGSFGSLGLGVGSGGGESEMETLAIDILDAETGALLWHGFTKQTLVRYTDPRRTTEHINAAVKAILAKFPPDMKRR